MKAHAGFLILQQLGVFLPQVGWFFKKNFFLNATCLHVFCLIRTSDCRILIILIMKFRRQN